MKKLKYTPYSLRRLNRKCLLLLKKTGVPGLGRFAAQSFTDQSPTAQSFTDQSPTAHENQSSMFFLQADPGSGKTYASVVEGLQKAKEGYVVIIAFPTKVLIDENFMLAEDLIGQNPSLNGVDVHVHNFNDQIPETNLFNIFMKGGSLIFTVHNYLKQKDHFFSFTPLFYFMNFFKERTFLVIDEGHIFLNECDSRIKITHGFFAFAFWFLLFSFYFLAVAKKQQLKSKN
jgi:hypothetical protein